jgi:hypothetical protein
MTKSRKPSEPTNPLAKMQQELMEELRASGRTVGVMEPHTDTNRLQATFIPRRRAAQEQHREQPPALSEETRAMNARAETVFRRRLAEQGLELPDVSGDPSPRVRHLMAAHGMSRERAEFLARDLEE